MCPLIRSLRPHWDVVHDACGRVVFTVFNSKCEQKITALSTFDPIPWDACWNRVWSMLSSIFSLTLASLVVYLLSDLKSLSEITLGWSQSSLLQAEHIKRAGNQPGKINSESDLANLLWLQMNEHEEVETTGRHSAVWTVNRSVRRDRQADTDRFHICWDILHACQICFISLERKKKKKALRGWAFRLSSLSTTKTQTSPRDATTKTMNWERATIYTGVIQHGDQRQTGETQTHTCSDRWRKPP